jgi:hypothetical protein
MNARIRDNLVGAALVLCVATPIVWWVGDTAKKTDTNAEKIARQAEGRKVAIGVLCGGLSAVSQKGHDVILGGAALPGRTPRDADRVVFDPKTHEPIAISVGRFARFLEAHGYPTARIRLMGAKQAAHDYSAALARGVESQAHVTGIVRRDGSLDCQRVQAASATAAQAK